MDDRNDYMKENGRTSGLMAREVGFGLTLSGWIALPVLFGFFIGKFVIYKFNLPTFVFYIIVGLSVLLSFYGLIKATLKYTKELENKAGLNNTEK